MNKNWKVTYITNQTLPKQVVSTVYPAGTIDKAETILEVAKYFSKKKYSHLTIISIQLVSFRADGVWVPTAELYPVG